MKRGIIDRWAAWVDSAQSDGELLWRSISPYIAVLSFVVAVSLLQPYFEARQYERMTGKQASYWDALWLDLRVISEAKDER